MFCLPVDFSHSQPMHLLIMHLWPTQKLSSKLCLYNTCYLCPNFDRRLKEILRFLTKTLSKINNLLTIQSHAKLQGKVRTEHFLADQCCIFINQICKCLKAASPKIWLCQIYSCHFCCVLYGACRSCF